MALSRVARVALLLNYCAGAAATPSTTICENCRSEATEAASGDLAAEPLKAEVGSLLGLIAEDKPSTTFCENCKTDATLPKADISESLSLAAEKPSTTFCENCKEDGSLPKADVGESLGLAEEKPSTTFCENCKETAALPKADVGESLGLAEEKPSTTFCENCKTDAALPEGDISQSVGLAEAGASASESIVLTDTDQDSTTTFCENCRSAGVVQRRVGAKFQDVGHRVFHSPAARAFCGASLLLLVTGAFVGPLLARRASRAVPVALQVQGEGNSLLQLP